MDYFTYLRGNDFQMSNMNFNLDNNAYNTPYQNSMPWPLYFQEKSTQYNLNSLITSIKNSIANEKNEDKEYSMLAEMAPNDEQKKIIYSIRDNELLHGKILRKIFNQLTGVMIPENTLNPNSDMVNTEKSYKELLEKYFMSELKAIGVYREMLAYSPNKQIYSMIMYIMTDEICHALKYQYLLMLNK